jgi:hypothetical protein
MLPVANPIFALFMTSPNPGMSSMAVIIYAVWRRRGAIEQSWSRLQRGFRADPREDRPQQLAHEE